MKSYVVIVDGEIVLVTEDLAEAEKMFNSAEANGMEAELHELPY